MLKPLSGSSPANLENLLVSKKLISPEQINAINQFISENGSNFGTALMFLGILSAERLAVVLKEKKVRHVSPQKIAFQQILKGMIPQEKALELQVFPLQVVDESGSRVLLLGMTDPLDTVAIHRVESITRTRVQPVFVSLDDLQWAYKKHYRTGLALFPAESTSGGEKTMNRRMDSIGLVPSRRSADSAKSSEVRALLSILVKKGLLTYAEFDEELKKYAP